MIVVEKDLHYRGDEPFRTAFERYFAWFKDQPWHDGGNTYVSTGDWFHAPKPTPSEYLVALGEIGRRKFKRQIILAGNHDYSRQFGQYSVDPLQIHSPVEYIKEKVELEIEGKSFLFLPFYYRSKANVAGMEEHYGQLTGSYDYVVYHFEDETIEYGGKGGIDLSGLRGRFLGGHVHHKLPSRYDLGMPVHSRKDEAGQSTELLLIDENEEVFVSVPNFLDYETVTFPAKPKVEAECVLLTVEGVPDRCSEADIRAMYALPGVWLKEWTREASSAVVCPVVADGKSLEGYMTDFCRDRAVSSEVKALLFRCLAGAGNVR